MNSTEEKYNIDRLEFAIFCIENIAVRRNFQQPIYNMGKIQQEMDEILPQNFFPVSPYTDGRRPRRQISCKSAGGNKQIEIVKV